jgi:cytoskeletal protein CcmA (bactofilin family)
MRNEKGFILVLCLMLLLMVTILGVAGMKTGTFGNIIAGNGLEGQKAFWIAEAGLHDAKDKLNTAASVNIFRNQFDSPIIFEYAGGSYTITTYPDPSDPANRVIVRSEGVLNNSRKIVETTMVKFLFSTPGALYTEAPVDIKGNVTIDGVSKPGIVTTLDDSTITGKLDGVIGAGLTPSIQDHSNNLSIQQYVDFLKGYADYSSPTLPSGSTWGSDANPIVVSLSGTIPKLGGNAACSGGSGVILVDGDLRIDGNFQWNGLVIATGTIRYIGTGNGEVTGGIMAGELNFNGTTNGWGDEFGGNAKVTYADMSNLLKGKLGTVRLISWKEVKN